MIKRYLCNDESLKAYRRQLRNYGTYAEAVLWPFLKNRQIEGALFRRQFSVGPFIMKVLKRSMKRRSSERIVMSDRLYLSRIKAESTRQVF